LLTTADFKGFMKVEATRLEKFVTDKPVMVIPKGEEGHVVDDDLKKN
jgi:uncharacterized membrane protein YcaP (DUF421 family)